MPLNGSGSTSAHLNGHSASGPLFSPISPGVSDGVGKLVKLMDDAQDHVKQINTSASEAQDLSPEELSSRFALLGVKIDTSKVVQDSLFDEITTEVKENLKLDIKKTLSPKIQLKITSEIESRVKTEVANWAQQDNLAQLLEKMLDENEVVLRNSRTQLENSKARRVNSTFDEVHNYEQELRIVWDSEGYRSPLYPMTLKHLFSYDDADVKDLLHFYGLTDCQNKRDNLNRFLAFIGVRFTIPEQPEFLMVNDSSPVGPGGNSVPERDGKNEGGQDGKENDKKKETSKQGEKKQLDEKQGSKPSQEHGSSPHARQPSTTQNPTPSSAAASSQGSTRKASEDVDKGAKTTTGEASKIASDLWSRLRG